MENLDTIIDVAIADNSLNSTSWFTMDDPETFEDEENDDE